MNVNRAAKLSRLFMGILCAVSGCFAFVEKKPIEANIAMGVASLLFWSAGDIK